MLHLTLSNRGPSKIHFQNAHFQRAFYVDDRLSIGYTQNDRLASIWENCLAFPAQQTEIFRLTFGEFFEGGADEVFELVGSVHFGEGQVHGFFDFGGAVAQVDEC